MEPKNHPLRKGTSSSSHHVSPVPAVNLPGCFRFLLDDDVHPCQKDLLVSDADGEKKTSKKSHPQSARNLTPPVSELRFYPLKSPGDRCFKCPNGGFCNSTHHPPIARPGGTWPENLMVFHGFSTQKIVGKTPSFFFDLERLERLLIWSDWACWVKDRSNFFVESVTFLALSGLPTLRKGLSQGPLLLIQKVL